MRNEVRFVHWLIWGLLGLVVVSVSGVFVTSVLKQRAQPLPVYGDVADFTLTNQFNQPVTRANLLGHVWIADIIFTRCPGPCLAMTRKMKSIQDQLPEDGSVKLVSLTADPDYDTPAVLAKYALDSGARSNRWVFLTGPKEAVYRLATDGLKLAVQENAAGQSLADQFIHSTRFVLVDAKGQIRSVSFDGEDEGSVREVVQAATQLLKESAL